MMSKSKINLFEAFAGIGSQFYALKKLNNIKSTVVGISEWDIRALHAYRAIHYSNLKDELIEPKHARLILEKKVFSMDGMLKYDLKKLNDKEIVKLYNTDKIVKNFGPVQNLVNSFRNINERINIFVYSFPCQDLSTGGLGKGMKRGSGTRSGLLWELENLLFFLSSVNNLPDVLLLENVRTLYSPSNRDDLKLWLDFLTSIGYENNVELLLNALDYGLPQNRNRAFVISINKKVTADPVKIKNSILNDKLSRDSLNVNDFVHLGYNSFEEEEAWLNKTPSREKMWEINKKDLKNCSFLGTITCNLDRSNNSGMFKYNDSYRLLTMREAFALMGFNKDVYPRIRDLGYSYRQINKMIGNSIAVNVLEVIFKNILKYVSF